MTKPTLQEELVLLQEEVSKLKTEKVAAIKEKLNTEALSKDIIEIKDKFEGEVEDIVKKVKEDYNNISPISAFMIFALGAIFGRLISSK